ncbi:MAG: hypothetical protein FWF15_11625 [Oscillospiraceae bacterium]|nr:hypothetical protein [Oscillospiraceae bacterium]
MKKKKIILIGLAVIMILAAFSCKSKDDGVPQETFPENIDIDLITKVGDTFTEILKALNDKDYEKYVSYYNIPQADKNLIIEGIKNASEQYTSYYTVYNVWAMENEDGTINATILIDNKSTSKINNATSVIRDTMYYILSESNGKFYIESYENGMSEQID